MTRFALRLLRDLCETSVNSVLSSCSLFAVESEAHILRGRQRSWEMVVQSSLRLHRGHREKRKNEAPCSSSSLRPP
jgi:hypothetical protein